MARQLKKPPVLAIAAVACAALAAASLLLPSGPTYDPYAWLIWGRDLAHLHLVTRGSGTSWKPLTTLIAALLSPLGGAQPSGWLVIARGGALFACFMAGRLAWRICGPRWGMLAAPAAAATLLLVHEYLRRTAVGESEGLMAGLGLLAIDRHLSGRRGQALVAATAVALMRPEAWPYLALYALYLWFALPRPPRVAIAGLSLLVPLLWFGGDWLGSGSLWTASDRALQIKRNTPGASSHPFTAVLHEGARMLPSPARAAIPAAIAVAIVGLVRARRAPLRADGKAADRLTLVLAAGAAAWTLIVAAMAARGYPGLPRFLFPALALAAVLCGVGTMRIAQAATAAVRAARLRPLAPVAAGACVAALAFLARPDVTLVQSAVRQDRAVAATDDALADAVRLAGGGQAVLQCGTPVAPWWTLTALAYDLGVQTTTVQDARDGGGGVIFERTSAARAHSRARAMLHVADRIDGWSVMDRCSRRSRHSTTRGRGLLRAEATQVARRTAG
jgi:hypothetical protein